MKKNILAFLSVLTITVFMSLGYTVSAYGLYTYHWTKDTTCSYSVGTDFTDSGKYSVTLADNQWNGISNRHVYIVNNNKGNSLTSATLNGVCDIFKAYMGTNYYLAATNLWYYTGTHHRSEGDIFVNVDYSIDATATSCPSDSYHLASIIAHEMGHLVGLDESYIDGAVMYYSLSKGTVRYTLSSDDISGYNAITWND